jgi:hypothetical protein
MEFYRPSSMSLEIWKTVPSHAQHEYNALLANYKSVRNEYNNTRLKKHEAACLKINKQLKEYEQWLEHIFIPPPPPPEIQDAKSPETACCICLVKKVNRCLPCGHTLCSECLPKLTECSCPTCRTAFKMETVKPLYL